MTPANMSEDEIVGPAHPPVFIYRPARWQSKALRLAMQKLDELHREDWRRGNRAGNPPRTLRLAQDGVLADVAAPSGLPRCCYDEDFLNSLLQYEYDALNIQDVDFDLVIPDDIDARQS